MYAVKGEAAPTAPQIKAISTDFQNIAAGNPAGAAVDEPLILNGE